MDDLHLNGELTAAIVENEDTDAAAARLESLLETRPQVGLVNDGQALLDIASLGHGGDVAVSHVEDANVMARLWQMGVNYISGYHVQEPEVVLLGDDPVAAKH